MNLYNAVHFNYKIISRVPSGENQLLNNVVESLYSNLPLPNKGYLRIIKIQALNNILANLCIAYNNNKFVAVSKRCNDYSFPKIFYGMEHYTYNIIIPLLISLRDNGYIGETPGFFDSDTGKGYRTRIWATLKLIELYIQSIQNEKLQYLTPIILKDSDKNLIEYRSSRFISEMKRFVIEYNELISSFDIVIPARKINNLTQKSDAFFNAPQLFTPNPINIYNIIISELQTGKGTPTPLLVRSWDNSIFNKHLECRLYRVFNNSKFNAGGRFYGSEYQQLNQEDRSLITINCNKTCEIDFKGLHLNMLYNFEGIDFQGDPYSIPNQNPELRPLLKLVSLIGINALTPKSAVDAFNFEIMKDYGLYQTMKKHNLKSKELFSQFENAHSQISKYFRSGYGIKLQYIDSKIAEEILKHFTRQEMPCLCIHDSFIVEESNKNELSEVMKEAYRKYLGFQGKVEIKF